MSSRMPTRIGAREARNRLSELLRQVKMGQRFTIMIRNQPVADLVPLTEARVKDHRAVIERFQEFIRENPVRGHVKLAELIKTGRE